MSRNTICLPVENDVLVRSKAGVDYDEGREEGKDGRTKEGKRRMLLDLRWLNDWLAGTTQ